MLTLLAANAAKNRALAIASGICGLFFYFLIGSVPLGAFSAPMATYSLATLGFALLVGLQGWAVVRKEKAVEADIIELVVSDAVA